MPQDLEELKQHPSVLSIYRGQVSLKRDGKEYVGLCPFHNEKTPSFRISSYKGTWVYKCFGCGASGDVLKFIQTIENCTFPEAIGRVKSQLGSSWDSTKVAEKVFTNASESAPAVSYSLEEYSKLEKALEGSEDGRKWLYSRGIKYDTARKLRLGFKSDLGKLCSQPGLSDKGWIAFPCIEGDRIVAIKYRSVVSKSFCKQGGMAKGDRTPLFNAQGIEPLEPVFVTEGECDAAILVQNGFTAVSIQSASTPLTAGNKSSLLEADYIVLAGDNDQQGIDYMTKLWSELRDKTYMLRWPGAYKDANEVFLKLCGGDPEAFRNLVIDLTDIARVNPMPNISSLQEVMKSTGGTKLSEHPKRLRFPWPKVDQMAIITPGGVASVMATSTKMGKTTWIMQTTIYGARKHDEVILNYQCELSPEEFSTMVTAHLLKKDRNHLSADDHKAAASLLSGVRYYIGFDPTLTKVDQVLDLIEAGIRRLGATTVVLDHIHFICRNEADTNKAQENAMQRIKRMATQYQVKFLVVGQPRKALQTARGRLVDINDWKGSESGVSDTHAVYAIHRDRVKERTEETKDDYDPITQIHLLGCRSKGDGGTYAELMYFGNRATFGELMRSDGQFVTGEKNAPLAQVENDRSYGIFQPDRTV